MYYIYNMNTKYKMKHKMKHKLKYLTKRKKYNCKYKSNKNKRTKTGEQYQANKETVCKGWRW